MPSLSSFLDGVVVGFVLIELCSVMIFKPDHRARAQGQYNLVPLESLEDAAAPKHSSEKALTGPCGIFMAFLGRMGLLLEARVFAGALIINLHLFASDIGKSIKDMHMLVTFGMQKVVWC